MALPGQDRHRVPSCDILPGQGHPAHPTARPDCPGVSHPPQTPCQPCTAALAKGGTAAPLPGPGLEPCPPFPVATSTSWFHHPRWAGGKTGPRPWSVPSRSSGAQPGPEKGRQRSLPAHPPTHPPASSACRALGTSAAFLRLPPLGWAPAKAAALPGAEGPRVLPTALGTLGDTGDTPQRGVTDGGQCLGTLMATPGQGRCPCHPQSHPPH